MLHLLIEGITHCLAGYFAESTVQKNGSLLKFFISIFFLMLFCSAGTELSCLFFELCEPLTFQDIIFALLISFSVALVCTVCLYLNFKCKNYKKLYCKKAKTRKVPRKTN